ncbi:putative ribosome biogenesis protein Rsa4 [Saccharata proteae CBS 121410]|uniref:Ribosome assembly protein 4 n=1 Tax=Saccharata proteae CBS 121410 TaxID=1314787 RepID=A0A9P4I0A3_9PEZI|nr:putative ribosome biogenesis protein Rsa4 [Saccharata proteae CBS 121410]
MSTVPPPPSKRQKREAAAVTSKQAEVPSIPDGIIRVRFVDQATGETGDLPTVSVPLAQAQVKNLETLLNSLKGQNDAADRIPYRFYYKMEGDGAKDTPLPESGDLYNTIIKPGKADTEKTATLHFAPQAVFRVAPVSRCSAQISGHGEAVLAVQFSPRTSSRMVSGSGDSTARILDCDTGTPVHTLKGHTSWVLAVSWSPSDDMIATGSMDNTVRLWDPKTGQALGGPMKGHSKWVTNLAWEPYHLQSPGRPRFASSSKDATVRVWDAVGRKVDFVLSGHTDTVSCVKWGGTGVIYTASHDRSVKVWDASKGTLLHTLKGHAHWVNHLALSTDFVLRTAYHDHTGVIPTTDEEKRAKAKQRFETAATTNNKIVERLVTASDDLTMHLWEPSSTTKPLARMTGHAKQVNHVTFSPDGLYIASAAFDNQVKLWNGGTGAFIAMLRGHVAAVYQCCFSPDSRLLVSASKDATLKVWNVAARSLAKDIPGPVDEVYAVDWSPDGMRVGSGGKDKVVRLFRE